MIFTASLYIGERLLEKWGRRDTGGSKRLGLCGWGQALRTAGNCVLFAGANLSGEKRGDISGTGYRFPCYGQFLGGTVIILKHSLDRLG